MLDSGQVLGFFGISEGQFDQRRIPDNPLPRPIFVFRRLLAPAGQGLESHALFGLQLAGSFDSPPGGVVVLFIQLTVIQFQTVFLEPAFAIATDDIRLQSFHHRDQVQDIFGRVIKLCPGQRSRAPLGAGLGFAETDAHQLLDQRRISKLQVIAQAGGRDLGVEYRLQRPIGVLQQQFEILAGGMHDFQLPAVGQQLEQGSEIRNRQVIDQEYPVPGRDLHQA